MYVAATDLNEQFTNQKVTAFNKMWTTYLKYARAKGNNTIQLRFMGAIFRSSHKYCVERLGSMGIMSLG